MQAFTQRINQLWNFNKDAKRMNTLRKMEKEAKDNFNMVHRQDPNTSESAYGELQMINKVLNLWQLNQERKE